MSDTTTDGWRVEVFFDGECRLCLREVKILRRINAETGEPER